MPEDLHYQHMTKRERRALRKQRQVEEQHRTKRTHLGRNLIQSLFIAVPMAGLIGFFIWGATNQKPVAEEDIIARGGIHWHPELSIYIDGARQPIPANIGIGAVHKPMHTHDDTGVIHLEFQGRVTKDDITLKKFFDIWGKQFNGTCILDACTSDQGTVTMTVNGKEQSEFEHYHMQDRDQIEIRYE